MDFAEDPPAAQKVLAGGGLEPTAKLLQPSVVLEIALNLLFQRLQHARNRNQHRDSLTADGGDNLGGFERVLKNDRAAHELWEEHAEKLPEDVDERQQVQEADG